MALLLENFRKINKTSRSLLLHLVHRFSKRTWLTYSILKTERAGKPKADAGPYKDGNLEITPYPSSNYQQ